MKRLKVFVDGTPVSIVYNGHIGGRATYAYTIGDYTATDISSGVGQDVDLAGAMRTLFCFLSACAESLDYKDRTGRDGENADLFPGFLHPWIRRNGDEFSMHAGME